MTAAALLALLRELGFRLRAERSQVLISPRDRLTGDDWAVLREHKGGLLALLDPWPDPPDDLPVAVVLVGRTGPAAWESLAEYQAAAAQLAVLPETRGCGDVPGAVPGRPVRR
jgi:hypothetical protein